MSHCNHVIMISTEGLCFLFALFNVTEGRFSSWAEKLHTTHKIRGFILFHLLIKFRLNLVGDIEIILILLKNAAISAHFGGFAKISKGSINRFVSSLCQSSCWKRRSIARRWKSWYSYVTWTCQKVKRLYFISRYVLVLLVYFFSTFCAFISESYCNCLPVGCSHCFV